MIVDAASTVIRRMSSEINDRGRIVAPHTVTPHEKLIKESAEIALDEKVARQNKRMERSYDPSEKDLRVGDPLPPHGTPVHVGLIARVSKVHRSKQLKKD